MRRAVWFALPGLVMSLGLVRADAPADPLGKAPSKFATHGDLKVHYKSLGEGTTAVVFVHGWCSNLTVWRDQAAAFDGKARLLFVDLPGFGRSDRPKIDYTIDLFARGVNAVMRDAGVDRAVLVGHSMGTPVVRQYYRLFPDKTKALVFVDGSLRPFAKNPAEAEKFLSMFKEETFKDDAPKFMKGLLAPDASAALRERLEKLVAEADPHVAISSMRNMFDPKLWKEDVIRVPAQALMADTPIWKDYKEFARKLVPDLDYRAFEGVGHFLFMEKPKEVNTALAEFLQKQGVMK